VEALFDECRPLGGVVAVQHGPVTWVGAEIDPGGPGQEGVRGVGARDAVATGAIDALELDLTGPLEASG
jgi:hypothetical protein